jgi:quercetin dioxygenase-like cupin family protein
MSEQLWKTEEVIGFADYVEYSHGSIVSKTLFDKPAGSLTLFAIAEGQGIKEHKSTFDATVTVLDGAAKFKVADKTYEVKEGQGLIMPANVAHAVLPGKAFKMLLIMIRS